ncbi:MAG: hypothetical protein QXK76_03085 [Candidatus Woesearchaeota archaeon]
MNCNARYLFVNDFFSERDLELRISKNDEIIFSNKNNYFYNNNVLDLEMNGGIIYIPKNTIFSINTENNVKGIIASRGYLHSNRNIDLTIYDDDLKLSLNAGTFLVLNNKITTLDKLLTDKKIEDRILRMGNAIYSFHEKFFSGLSAPRIKKTKNGIKADYVGSQSGNIFFYEICEYENGVYLSSENILNINIPNVYNKDRMIKDNKNKSNKILSNIHDNLLSALSCEDVDKAKNAFYKWIEYVCFKDKIKENPREDSIAKGLKGFFNEDSFM